MKAREIVQNILKAMGYAARLGLGTGRLKLTGRTPNGQQFIANPQRFWLIDSSHAVINGNNAGPVGPLAQQAGLNDFLIPQRGVFAVARAFINTPAATKVGPRTLKNERCVISR